MQDSIQVAAAQNGLTLKAFRGDGGVLLAFDLDQHLTANLAGFAVQCTPPNGPAAYLLNRLSFDTPITAATTPQARQWTPSNLAPFQKFRWKHFPADLFPRKVITERGDGAEIIQELRAFWHFLERVYQL